MKFLFIVAVMLASIIYTNQDPIESLEDVLVYPMEPAMKKREIEREAIKRKSQFIQFVEDKLIQHTQALEQLLKTTANSEELLKKLIDNLTKNMDEPKMPEKIEVHRQTRRSNTEDSSDNPLIKFGKGFPTYGILFKDMIMRAFERDDAPTPLVEKRSNNFESRRSFGGKPIVVPTTDDDSPSPWCSIAVLCHRTYNPVCGYDDNFGYGKFDDLCHMLQVNCYWKYNFALVPSCRPVFK